MRRIEIFFSIVQRKVLTPAAAHDLDALEPASSVSRRTTASNSALRWRFTRAGFDRRLLELAA